MKDEPLEGVQLDSLFDKMDTLLVRVETVADRLIAKLEALEKEQPRDR